MWARNRCCRNPSALEFGFCAPYRAVVSARKPSRRYEVAASRRRVLPRRPARRLLRCSAIRPSCKRFFPHLGSCQSACLLIISVRRGEADSRGFSARSRDGMPREKQNHYRPSDREPFMNERQRDYFRNKLLAWREDILREAQETLQHLQDENQNHPDLADRASSERSGRSSSERVIGSASWSPRSMPRCSASRREPTAFAKRPASRSRCGAWKRARSPPCRSRPKNATSGASASIATTSFGVPVDGVTGRMERRGAERKPRISKSDFASLYRAAISPYSLLTDRAA